MSHHTPEQQRAWLALGAALDVWLAHPSPATESALDAAWLHYHSI